MLPSLSLAASLPARGVTDTVAPRTPRSCLWLQRDLNQVPLVQASRAWHLNYVTLTSMERSLHSGAVAGCRPGGGGSTSDPKRGCNRTRVEGDLWTVSDGGVGAPPPSLYPGKSRLQRPLSTHRHFRSGGSRCPPGTGLCRTRFLCAQAAIRRRGWCTSTAPASLRTGWTARRPSTSTVLRDACPQGEGWGIDVRYFPQFPAILLQSPFARPPRVRVGALQLALSTSHLLSVAYRLLLPAGQTCRGLE